MKNQGELSIKLQKKRKEKGVTYQVMAEKTGLSIATIEAVFQGKQKNPTLTTLQKICDVLELSIDNLINRESFIIKKIGNTTVFSHDKFAKDIVVPARLLNKIEDPDGIITIAYLEAAKDFVHTLLKYYKEIKIMVIKGSAYVNGKKLKLFEVHSFNKSEILSGLQLKALKGAKGIFCFLPGIKIKL